MPPRPAMPRSASSAWRAKSATLNGSSGLDEVEAVMRDAAPFRERDLGRADVEAAIHLPRVGRDDLGARDRLCEVQREAGLAGRGRAGDDDQRRIWKRRPVPGVSALAHRATAADVACEPSVRGRERDPGASTGRRGRCRTSAKCADQRSPGRGSARAGVRGCGRRARPLPRADAPRPRARGHVVLMVVDARRRHRVCEDLRRQTQPALIAFEADPLLELEERVEAAALLGGWDVVGEALGGRARSRREGGREDGLVADLLEEAQRRLELRLGLAREADDDVGRERDARARPRGSAPRRSR